MATDSIPRKQCNACKEYFPPTAEYFHRRKASPDGLGYTCKPCAIARTKKNAADNPERVRQNKKEYAVAHKQELAEYWQGYYAKNGDVIRQRAIDWNKNNPERKHETNVRYYEENKEYVTERNKEYAEAHPDIIAKAKRDYILRDPARRKKQAREYTYRHNDKVKSNSRRYRRENPHKTRQYHIIRKTRIKNVGGIFTPDDILNLFYEQNEQCAYCGIRLFWNIPADFHVDHIQPVSRGGSNNPDNLCLTCEFCNLSKADKTYQEWLATRGW